MRRRAARLILAAVLLTSSSHRSLAAINSLGDVSPVPPVGGGTVAGPLRIGNASVGTVSIGNGTPLSSSSNAFVGDDTNGIGIVTLDGFGSNWTLTTPGADLFVGVDGTGSVSLSDFARMVVPDDTTLGGGPTGVGEINIADLGTTWSTGNLIVGDRGRGIVNISGGGQLVAADATIGSLAASEGRVTITDNLSMWHVDGGLVVGHSGRGTVSVFDGGLLRTTGLLTTLGALSGAIGSVEISGTGASWETGAGSVTLGGGGTGKLHLFNGGQVTVGGNLSVSGAMGSRGEVWVDGLNSRLTVAQIFGSGVDEAVVTLSNGGVMRAPLVTWVGQARMTLSGGRLEVTATNGFTNHGLVRGDGTIDAIMFHNQQDGSTRGRLEVGGDEHLLLTGGLNNAGFIDVDGGTLEVLRETSNNFDIDARNGAILRIGGAGLDNNNGGQLAITAGEVDVFGDVDNNSGAQILLGNGASAVFHDTVTNSGDLVVMSGSTLLALEQLNLLGNQSNLSLYLTAEDAFAQTTPIQAAGQIILEGNLTVTLASGYQPQAGDVFPLLASDAGLAGVFFNENLPGLGVGLDWEIQRTTNSMSLAVVEVAGVAGDFDNDGDVDGRDFVAWQRNTSVGDLADWQANYGTGALLSAGMTVPEPATAILLAWSAAILHSSRRRSNRVLT